ncbi:MAG: hypothetical protein AAGD07_25105 [Planctomycetota bacterium]
MSGTKSETELGSAITVEWARSNYPAEVVIEYEGDYDDLTVTLEPMGPNEYAIDLSQGEGSVLIPVKTTEAAAGIMKAICACPELADQPSTSGDPR